MKWLILIGLPLWTTALYYLGAWALITRPIWRRYRGRFKDYMECSACSGTAWGFLVGLIAGYQLDLAGQIPLFAIGVAFGSMVWTPIVARRMLFDLADVKPADDPTSERS